MKIEFRLAMEFVWIWCREPDSQPETSDLKAPQIVVPILGNTQSNVYLHQVACQPVIPWEVATVQVVHERCCGLDVHKDAVMACVLTPGGKSRRTFSTMTRDLMELADWLGDLGVTHVAMESTGVHWKPV